MTNATENKKKTAMSFGKLMATSAIVIATAISVTGCFKNEAVNLDNLQETSVSQEAKDCTILALKSMQVLSDRSLQNSNYSFIKKQDNKALEETVAPLAKNGSGSINPHSPSDNDVKEILNSCMNEAGYLSNIQKIATYVVKSHEGDRVKFEEDKSVPMLANIKINVSKAEQTKGATISYKMK